MTELAVTARDTVEPTESHGSILNPTVGSLGPCLSPAILEKSLEKVFKQQRGIAPGARLVSIGLPSDYSWSDFVLKDVQFPPMHSWSSWSSIELDM